MKAKGYEIIDFFDNHWPSDDWYYDDGAMIYDEDKLVIEREKTYNLSEFGLLYWQGKGDAPQELEGKDFEWWFKKWKKKNDAEFSYIVVKVPKEWEEEVKESILSRNSMVQII